MSLTIIEFPAVWNALPAARSGLLRTCIEQAISRELPALGTAVRRPSTLPTRLRAYASAVSTTAAFEAIADAVEPGPRPSRTTVLGYRDALLQSTGRQLDRR